MLEEEFTSLNGLARDLRLPRTWLLEEAKAGKIPCLRVGRRYVFCVEAVRRVLAERASLCDGGMQDPPQGGNGNEY